MATVEEPFDIETGEVRQHVNVIDTSALSVITRADIDMQIATAKRWPRVGPDGDMQPIKKRMWDLIGSVDAAKDCIYALPRGKEKNEATGRWEQKIVTGPTVRFAEAMVSAWGNSRCGARVVSEEQESLTAQGVFHDLENNVVISFEVRKRITDKEGRRYNADMITMQANAACSTALRNAILRGIPQQVWKPAFVAAQRRITGDLQTLSERRASLIDQFKAFQMTGAMVCQILGLNNQSEITLDHLVVIQGMLTALQDGDATVESLMSDAVGGDAGVAAKGRATVEAIKKQYQKQPTQEGIGAAGTAQPAMQAHAQENFELKKMAEQAQVKLREKRQQTKAGEPTKVSEIVEGTLPLDEGKEW